MTRDKADEAVFTEDMASTMRDIIREELTAALSKSLLPVNKCLEELKSQLTTCTGKVAELESAAVGTDVRLSELEREQPKTAKENDYLRMKVEQLENQSRKFNIRILDLPNGVEAGNPTAYTTKLLRDWFGEEIVGTGPLISVAHRTGPAMKDSRCMIARLYSLDIKMKITKKAAECRSFTYNGNKICIHSDVSAETLKLSDFQRSEIGAFQTQNKMRFHSAYCNIDSDLQRGITQVFYC